MNRRSFLSGIIKAGVSAAILPPALTYSRTWVKPRQIIVPYWYQLNRADSIYSQDYLDAMENMLANSMRVDVGFYGSREQQRKFVNTFFFNQPVQDFKQ